MHGAQERLVLAPDLADIERASLWAREAATRLRVPPAVLFPVDLCLEEALSNTIRYGFGEPPPPGAQLELTLTREAVALRVTIEDNAAPFDPSTAPQPAMPTDIETAQIGGFGIHLMRKFTQAMAYERIDDRNRLQLWFAIGSD